MPLPLMIDEAATAMAEELALLSARASVAGLNATSYFIDMARDEVLREAVKIALPQARQPILLPDALASAVVLTPPPVS